MADQDTNGGNCLPFKDANAEATRHLVFGNQSIKIPKQSHTNHVDECQSWIINLENILIEPQNVYTGLSTGRNGKLKSDPVAKRTICILRNIMTSSDECRNFQVLDIVNNLGKHSFD
jgi:hypothetical protein